MKRTPLKKGNSTLSRGGGLKKSSSTFGKNTFSPLKKSKGGLKTKPKTEEQKQADRELSIKDDIFYNEIWDERPHICESCDKYLGNTMSRMFMDHLLVKSLYDDLRHEKDNIGLVCADCHYRRTNGFPTERHQELIDKAKEKFL